MSDIFWPYDLLLEDPFAPGKTIGMYWCMWFARMDSVECLPHGQMGRDSNGNILQTIVQPKHYVDSVLSCSLLSNVEWMCVCVALCSVYYLQCADVTVSKANWQPVVSLLTGNA